MFVGWFKSYKNYFENLLGLVVILVVIFVGAHYFKIEQIQTWVETAGPWAPLGLIVAKISTLVFAPISGGPLYPLAGAVFGWPLGVLYLLIGDVLGSTIAFYLSRLFGRRVVERLVRGQAPLVEEIVGFMESTRGFLLARVCFAALPEAASYAAGLTRIGFTKFILISSAVGLIPIMILAGAGSWLAVGQNPWLIGSLALVGLLAAAAGGVILVKIARRRRLAETTKTK